LLPLKNIMIFLKLNKMTIPQINNRINRKTNLISPKALVRPNLIFYNYYPRDMKNQYSVMKRLFLSMLDPKKMNSILFGKNPSKNLDKFSFIMTLLSKHQSNRPLPKKLYLLNLIHQLNSCLLELFVNRRQD